ncbi:MAG: transcriptional repressor [Planctomycetota bacterium]
MPHDHAAGADPAVLLREHGLRCTDNRERVLAFLRRALRPVSQGDIMAHFPAGTVNRVSVYRILHRLVAAGLVHRVLSGRRRWLFESSDHCTPEACHSHFTCRVCQAVSCIEVFPLPAAQPAGYRVERQKVYLEGVCPRCVAR